MRLITLILLFLKTNNAQDLVSLSSLWNNKIVAGLHLFPTHSSKVYPSFISTQSNGHSVLHLQSHQVADSVSGHEVHSLCSYEYGNFTFYVLNLYESKGDSKIVMNLTLPELHKRMDINTQMKVEPSFICAGPQAHTFTATWKTPGVSVRHFIVRLRPLDEILLTDQLYAHRGYYPSSLQVFPNGTENVGLMIWKKGYGVRYRIMSGSINYIKTSMYGSDLMLNSINRLPRQTNRKAKYWAIWKTDEFSWTNKEIPKTEIPLKKLTVNLAKNPEQEKIGTKPLWETVDNLLQNFMRSAEIPSISVAVLYKGQPLHVVSYGYANLRNRERATPYSKYRIASISKTLTAMGIVHLVEKRLISMNSAVFGPNGILWEYYLPRRSQFMEITVANLLEHTTGAWSHSDKREFNKHEKNRRKFLQSVLNSTWISFNPGDSFVYSNIGYVYLGRIIEKISGQSYENFIKSSVLTPLNVEGIIGREEPTPDEVQYYSLDNANSYTHWNPQLLDAAVGWVLSPMQIAKVFASLESEIGRRYRMLFPGLGIYGRGIQIGSEEAIYHKGSLAGSEGLAYANKGVQVAMLTNMRGREENLHTDWMYKVAKDIADTLVD